MAWCGSEAWYQEHGGSPIPSRQSPFNLRRRRRLVHAVHTKKANNTLYGHNILFTNIN